MRYSGLTHPSPASIPQSQPLNERQAPNDGGGYSYTVDSWQMLDRFLILGTEGGTYTVNQAAHTKRNYDSLKACLTADPARAIARIVGVSWRGLAIKQDAAIFALAVAASFAYPTTPLEWQHTALKNVNLVCRTASTFFQFLEELKAMRKLSGRAVRHTIASWYTSNNPERVAYQMVKYRQRNNWTHRDALRLGHVKAGDGNDALSWLFQWAVKGSLGESSVYEAVPALRILEGFEKLQKAETPALAASLISAYKLPRECVPTQLLDSPLVWEALLETMPLTALIRNLGNMSKCGLLVPGSDAAATVVKMLGDEKRLTASRIHPVSVLVARKVYESGKGVKGAGTWDAVPNIVAELDDAFYKTFVNVVPTGKRLCVGIDVSGSMTWEEGLPGGILPYEVAAAMAMVWVATEPLVEVMGFSDNFVSLGLHRKMSLNEAMSACTRSNFDHTDCALPMTWASSKEKDFDAFIVITDNDTNAGRIHPSVALNAYRKERVPGAKQIVLATTASNFTIADPQDPGALDIAGFSPDVPLVISSFLSS